MAKNVSDGCIFCDPAPCSCSAKQKKAPLARKTARPSVKLETSSPQVESRKCTRVDCPGNCQTWEHCVAEPAQQQRAGLSAVRRKPVLPLRSAPEPPPVPVVIKSAPLRDEELVYAVTCIADAGLLDMSEMQKHRGLIDLPDARLKAIDWRQRNARKAG